MYELCDREQVLRALNAAWEFVPGTFDEIAFWRRTDSGSVWFAHTLTTPATRIAVETVGMALARDPDRLDRPSTAFIRRFGLAARRGVVTLEGDDFATYLRGGDVGGPRWEGERGQRFVVHPRFGAVGRARCERGLLVSELPRELRVP